MNKVLLPIIFLFANHAMGATCGENVFAYEGDVVYFKSPQKLTRDSLKRPFSKQLSWWHSCDIQVSMSDAENSSITIDKDKPRTITDIRYKTAKRTTGHGILNNIVDDNSAIVGVEIILDQSIYIVCSDVFNLYRKNKSNFLNANNLRTLTGLVLDKLNSERSCSDFNDDKEIRINYNQENILDLKDNLVY